jgi:hypothetical protein
VDGTLPDGYVVWTTPTSESDTPLTTNSFTVQFNQPMQADGNGGAVNIIGAYEMVSDSGESIAILAVAYDPTTLRATVTFDTANPDWTAGTRYAFTIKTDIKNACGVEQGGAVVVSFMTEAAKIIETATPSLTVTPTPTATATATNTPSATATPPPTATPTTTILPISGHNLQVTVFVQEYCCGSVVTVAEDEPISIVVRLTNTSDVNTNSFTVAISLPAPFSMESTEGQGISTFTDNNGTWRDTGVSSIVALASSDLVIRGRFVPGTGGTSQATSVGLSSSSPADAISTDNAYVLGFIITTGPPSPPIRPSLDGTLAPSLLPSVPPTKTPTDAVALTATPSPAPTLMPSATATVPQPTETALPTTLPTVVPTTPPEAMPEDTAAPNPTPTGAEGGGGG